MKKIFTVVTYKRNDMGSVRGNFNSLLVFQFLKIKDI
jgi:hypothetical protein